VLTVHQSIRVLAQVLNTVIVYAPRILTESIRVLAQTPFLLARSHTLIPSLATHPNY
jgi:hypothetical protein